MDRGPRVWHSQLISYTTSTRDTLQETQATVAICKTTRFVVSHADLTCIVAIAI